MRNFYQPLVLLLFALLVFPPMHGNAVAKDALAAEELGGCTANFSFTVNPCSTVTFTDLSTSSSGNITIWQWNFGDGSTSSLQNPTHNYPFNGVYTVVLNIRTSQGCATSITQLVTINCGGPSCQAAYNTVINPCSTVKFTDVSTSSPGSINFWSWRFGDGNISSSPSPTHTYAANGVYFATLVIRTTDACVDSITQAITINCAPGCGAAFSALVNPCSTVTFTDASTATLPDSITGWAWDFGDGNTSTQQNPNHTYAGNGVYPVTLIVTSATGCMDSLTQQLTVNCTPPSCQAAFSSNVSPCSTATFTDASVSTQGGITGWQWDFGDGNTSTQQNPAHTYAGNGTYPVTLIVNTSQNCSDTITKSTVINCPPPGGCASAFSFFLNPCSTAVFTDASSTSQGTLNSWQWDFGDGNTSSMQNPSHTYASNGIYTVVLISGTDLNCADTATRLVTINCPPPGGCVSAFSFTLNPCSTAVFTDASNSAQGNITSWVWSFGDGSNSTSQNPNHTYASNGVYTVSLVINTDQNCSDTSTQVITLNCPPPPTCNAAYTFTLNPCSTAVFTDASTTSGMINSWKWDFGDGNVSTMQNPSHTYSSNGNFTVSLIIVTDDNCSDTLIQNISVNCAGASCNSQFTAVVNPCSTVTFTDASLASPGTVSSWFWDFGDGNTSTSQNPMHTYTSDGIYTVNLIISTTDNCSDTSTQVITIACPSCTAGFSFSQPTCDSVRFTDLSTTSPGTVIGWSWYFGDGNSSNLQNPAHLYAANGSYTVTLVMLSSDGCQDTTQQTVTVNCVPASCQAAFASMNQVPYQASFTDASTASGTIVSWNWTFGDGGTSTQQNPTHTYSTAGNYQVCLEITTDDSCTSTFCDSTDILLNQETGLTALSGLSLYPNPADAEIRIDFSLTTLSDIELQVFSATGKQVFSKKLAPLEAGSYTEPLNTGELSQGIYLLRLRSGTQQLNRQFAVQR